MRCFGYLSFLLAIVLVSCSDKISTRTTPLNRVTIVENDTIVTFGIWNERTEVPVKIDRRYHYYVRNTIKSAQGSYIGKPLDGEYVVATRSNALVRKGSFSKGVPKGIWIRWHPNGIIEETVRWKSGVPVGKFQTYFEDGKKRMTGSFKSGRLSGKVFSYDREGNRSIQYYENGVLKESAKKEKPDSVQLKRPPKKVKVRKEKKKVDDSKLQESNTTTEKTGTEREVPKDEKAPRKKSLVKKSSKAPDAQKTNE